MRGNIGTVCSIEREPVERPKLYPIAVDRLADITAAPVAFDGAPDPVQRLENARVHRRALIHLWAIVRQPLVPHCRRRDGNLVVPLPVLHDFLSEEGYEDAGDDDGELTCALAPVEPFLGRVLGHSPHLPR